MGKKFSVNNVSRDPQKLYCISFGKNVSFEQKGRSDVVNHCEATEVHSVHNKNVRAITVSSRIALLEDSLIPESNVMNTDILHTKLLIERNVSVKTA